MTDTTTDAAATADAAKTADAGTTAADAAKGADAKTTDAAKTETLVGKDAGTGSDKTEPAPFDWRKEIAGDDEKTAKDLERVTDLKSLYKRLVDTQAALRDGGRIKLLGQDASEDDIKAFNKAIGVPDKVDGYKVKMPEGITLDDSEKAQLKTITEYLHGKGSFSAAPDTVQAAHDLFFKMREDAQASLIAQAAQFSQDSEKALRKEWGADYAKNIAYTGPGPAALIGPEAADELRTLRLANGALLGDHPLYVKLSASAGRLAGQDPNFWAATQMQGDTNSLESRKAEIMKWRTSSVPGDREKYAKASQPGGELSIINERLELVRQGRAA